MVFQTHCTLYVYIHQQLTLYFSFLCNLKQGLIEQRKLDVRNRATILELLAFVNKRSR